MTPDLPTREPETIVRLRNGAVKLTRRAEPNAQATINGYLADGDTIRYRPAIEGQDIGAQRGNRWIPIFISGGTRWDYVHSHYIELPDYAETPQPEPEPEPPAIDAAVQAYIDAQLAAAETRLKAHTETRLDQVTAAFNQQWTDLARKLVHVVAPYIGLQATTPERIEWTMPDNKQEKSA